ncbi:MAG: 4'-phosphopantetheinyl transferase superfamily protein [Propionibacteriaceae bacterium]|jgi:holo-[acyl-carrier protein] synthase|nr:4'-phosphopantetheinyl transferase superfamily protein [Propionibacteriaceae bacterium]
MDNDDDRVSCAPRIGCDLAEIEAVRESVAVFGERYLGRVYSMIERSQTSEAPERLAARFAGKEAVLKLLGVDGLQPRQVEIVADASGVPGVRLSAAAQASARAQGIGDIAISLSHEGGLALATAVALATRPLPGRTG